ncbi:hypothetical protein EVAR_56209_1 [Eumeta japonica]|uniref:Uncharacterized protein n=1 Tax=Eumeta variegata TaxID=151549 RepID=A0A4C1Y841_EUMVA|nr:hypothetical protein EVAR_56209_1 [Eumeta japonica]
MDTRNPRGVTSTLPASWEGTGSFVYTIQLDLPCNVGIRSMEKEEGVSNRSSHTLDEKQQRKFLGHVRILRECGFSEVESAHFCAASKLATLEPYRSIHSL